MTLKLKAFASGTLAAAKATLYTVAADKSVSARVTLHNTSSGTVRFYLYTNPGGTSRLVDDITLDPRDTYHSDYMELEEGDKIEGYAAAADLVVYRVNGIERDQP